MVSPVTQRFLDYSGVSRIPQARRQWHFTHVESRTDACMICGRISPRQYGVTHRNGAILLLDRACILHFIYLPGVTAHRSKAAVLHALTEKYATQETLRTLGFTALIETLTPSEHALLIKTLARSQHWHGPISALTVQRAWDHIVPLLTGVPVSELGDSDQARLWSLLVPPPAAPTVIAPPATLRTVS